GRGRRGRNGGQGETGAGLTLEWLDGCGLFKPLDEGEPAYSSGVLLEEVAELLRDLAINAHAMVEGEVPEQRVPRRNDMLVVFDESLLAEVGLVNLTFGFALVEEPVVTTRRTDPSRRRDHLRCTARRIAPRGPCNDPLFFSSSRAVVGRSGSAVRTCRCAM